MNIIVFIMIIFIINLVQRGGANMSWLDSSFGFAKTALSQAQKSIDRVLDIQETHEENGSRNVLTT